MGSEPAGRRRVLYSAARYPHSFLGHRLVTPPFPTFSTMKGKPHWDISPEWVYPIKRRYNWGNLHSRKKFSLYGTFSQRSVPTPLLRTLNPCIQGSGEFARRIVGAGQKPPELSILDDHRVSTFFTLRVGLHLILSVSFHLSRITAFG